MALEFWILTFHCLITLSSKRQIMTFYLRALLLLCPTVFFLSLHSYSQELNLEQINLPEEFGYSEDS